MHNLSTENHSTTVLNPTFFSSIPSFSYAEGEQQPDINYQKDAVAVLDSVVSLFLQYFSDINAANLLVINNPAFESPMKVSNQPIIFLTASRYCWAQFIYQFSHEFCHYIISKQVVQPMRWFEETICELSSHFFLLKSVERWSIKPPYPHWRSYSASILDYVLKLQNTNISFSISELLNPSSELIKFLENDEYQREFNRAIAIQLLPYFIDSPELWKIVYYLPEFSAQNTFQQNLHLLQEISGQPIENIILALAK